MDVRNGEPRRTIPLKKFLTDYRSLLDDRQLMEKYGLSARSFVNLIKSLVQKNFITAQDLAMRRELAVQRDQVKEIQFLSSLYICGHCGHPSPTPFKTCPACEMDVEDSAAAGDISGKIQTQGSNIYLPPTQVQELPESTAASGAAAKNSVDEGQTAAERGSGEQDGSSALGSVRSFFSKLKKK